MTINPMEAVSGGLFTPLASPSSSTSKAADDKQTFLALLVAQLKYQDPSKPADSSQFMAQTAQFTSLEKMQDVADRMNQLVFSQTAFGASNLVGRTVSYLGADGSTTTGVVHGVTFGSTGPQLTVDGTTVALSAVQSVGDGTTTA